MTAELLLAYCTNLCFYFYLKATGTRVADHPVVAQLVEERALLEKIKPLEAKLKYQIDKLVRAASSGAAGTARDSARPQPSRLVGLHEGDADADGADAAADADGGDGKFRPSRLAPMPYDPDGGMCLPSAPCTGWLYGDTSAHARTRARRVRMRVRLRPCQQSPAGRGTAARACVALALAA